MTKQGAAVLSAVKDLGNHKRGLVDDDEFRAIVGRVRAGGQTPV